ncbi:bifunctional DNA primase/polymerase [Tropicibacter sp. S64]|uniref:bifunctional DNA primase/polymerase n=1 Tax=Tropicibacter sp. S64 TaxID=3415122 RepID=UPI003C79D013
MAVGRPEGAGHVTFGEACERLVDLGYEPLPLKPGQKVPAVSRWSSVLMTPSTIDGWRQKYARCGVGLRTGRLVGLDIDILDADLAHEVQALAERRFGETLVRVGLWPKRLLLYRTDAPFAKMKVGQVELLGAGQQFVTFGRHPATHQPYRWVTGDTPLDVALDDLPSLDVERASAFLAEITQPLPGGHAGCRTRPTSPGQGSAPLREASGRVVDGRDSWLSTIAFHAVWDAIDKGRAGDIEAIANAAWFRFLETADLSRPSSASGQAYGPDDATKKVQDKLRLSEAGRLPVRMGALPVPEYSAPTLSVEDGRAQLRSELLAFADEAFTWWHDQPERDDPPPRLGLRATVGLGKSAVSREALLSLIDRLQSANRPHRVLFLTPSHALAEETAGKWRELGRTAAVLRGYERKDPQSGAPMCRNLNAVRIALDAGEPVPPTCCKASLEVTCVHLKGCQRKKNEAEVARAEIVVAPYDLLFNKPAESLADLGVLLIDEGCWSRALETDEDMTVESLTYTGLSGRRRTMSKVTDAARQADLDALRCRLRDALSSPGPVPAEALLARGLTAEVCEQAMTAEYARINNTGLRPDADANDLQRARFVAARNVEARRLARIWCLARDGLVSGAEIIPGLKVLPPDPDSGAHLLHVTRLQSMHPDFANVPLLHLDATLRPDLASAVLPPMENRHLDVVAPHMHLTQVHGRFSKSALIARDDMAADEQRACHRRLRAVVDWVSWKARMPSRGGTLVVTHRSLEATFAAIPSVVTAHFNGLAGLDCFGTVAQLIVVGRPMPSPGALDTLAYGFFGDDVQEAPVWTPIGVHMRQGPPQAVRAMRYPQKAAESLRAAVCDDELIQAIGRGRGVNRTAENPLIVYLLADVALPLVHDALLTWETEQPDILQRMLLAGIAVDSPADAATLHPDILANAEQAKKVFARTGFKGQTLISIYKGLSLKSASYKRPGRGRGWQRCWWIEGPSEAARSKLEDAVGALAAWRPDPFR